MPVYRKRAAGATGEEEPDCKTIPLTSLKVEQRAWLVLGMYSARYWKLPLFLDVLKTRPMLQPVGVYSIILDTSRKKELSLTMLEHNVYRPSWIR